MFLERLLSRNAALATTAIRLHQSGDLLANTYLLDLDTVHDNTAALSTACRGAGISAYFMAKQYGRNPDVSRAVIDGGISSAVCVDLQDMEAHTRNQIPIGHVGHLVQPYRGSEDTVISTRPEVVTVFSIDVARRLAVSAAAVGHVQSVLLRVCSPGDQHYFGHGGGIRLDDVEAAGREINAMPGLRVVGVTNFPCLLADPDSHTVRTTYNFTTILKAADRLRSVGINVEQINAPGTTSALTIPDLAAAGATHVEPGSALHGTTPLHVFEEDAPELPAVIYVSEISHLQGDDAYVFAAGYYIDKVLGDYELTALCGRDDSALEVRHRVDTAPADAIHYYAIIRDARRAGLRVGDTVIFCFRPQVFVTRGRTQALMGLHTPMDDDYHSARLLTRFDNEARPVEGVS